MTSPFVTSVANMPSIEHDEPMRVLLIDPDDVSRAGLRALLENDERFALVGQTGTNGVALAQQLQPDLVVVDPACAGHIDTSLIAALVAAAPDSHLCIYTTLILHKDVILVVLAGVDGYLLKGGRGSDNLRHQLFTVGHVGDLIIDRAILLDARARLRGRVRVTEPDPKGPVLTSRQQCVLVRLNEGLKRETIANVEGMHLRTVGRILEELFEAFDVASSVELVVEARRRGYLP